MYVFAFLYLAKSLRPKLHMALALGSGTHLLTLTLNGFEMEIAWSYSCKFVNYKYDAVLPIE